MPGSRPGIRKAPSALVTLVRTTPVLVLVTVTVTPGRTASPWSRARPLNVLVPCANADPMLMSTRLRTTATPCRTPRSDTRIYLPPDRLPRHRFVVRERSAGGGYHEACRTPRYPATR